MSALAVIEFFARIVSPGLPCIVPIAPECVDPVRHGLQMLRVDASTITTQVVDFTAGRNGSDIEDIRRPMGVTSGWCIIEPAVPYILE